MTKFHQNYVMLLAAVGFALLIGFSGFIWNAPDLWQRMVFGAALYLLSKDVIATASIDRGERGFSNLNRWIYAFYLAGYFGLFMLLFTWPGTEGMAQILPGVMLGGALFGFIMSFVFESKTYPYAHHFNTEPTGKFAEFYKLFSKIWPVLSLLGIYFLAFASSQGAPKAELLFFVSIGLWFLFPRYSRVTKGSAIWANFPRAVGMALLILPLLASLL